MKKKQINQMIGLGCLLYSASSLAVEKDVILSQSIGQQQFDFQSLLQHLPNPANSNTNITKSENNLNSFNGLGLNTPTKKNGLNGGLNGLGTTINNINNINVSVQDPLDNINNMIYLRFHLIENKFDEMQPITTPRKLWRVGTEFFRSEEDLDPVSNLKQLVIVSEPDMWVINPNNKTGLHAFDNQAATHVNIFEEEPELGWDVEFGRELYYFKKNHAQEIKTADGVDYILENEKTRLVLTTDIKNTPQRLALFAVNHIVLPLQNDSDIKKNQSLQKDKHKKSTQLEIQNFNTDNVLLFALAYDEYRLDLTPDYKLFILKDDIDILNQNHGKKKRFISV